MPKLGIALALFLLAFSAAYAKSGVRSANTDTDRDGLPDYLDNCQLIANVNQRDTDGDGIGNFCDPDLNNDLIVNLIDLEIFNLAFGSTPVDVNWNPDADFDGDDDVDNDDLDILNAFFFGPPGPGGPDADGDAVFDYIDNCLLLANVNQRDTDGDGFGNICDPDLNNDLIVNLIDLDIFNLAFGSTPVDVNWNPDADFDGDDDVDSDDLDTLDGFLFGPPGPGSSPADADADGIPDALDNCILEPNLLQQDTNGEGFGNICDPDLNNDLFVDFVDLNILNDAFGSMPGNVNWNPDADLDSDGDVDSDDLDIQNAYFFAPPGPSSPDVDGDAILNADDICTYHCNEMQIDSDGDGYGNRCDPDIGSPAGGAGVDDWVVNFSDLGFFKAAIFTVPGDPAWNPSADFNYDLAINFSDLGIMKSFFFGVPGPSCAELPLGARGPFCAAPDTDGDGIPDYLDNCMLIANLNQRDTNVDGFGNICDPDLDDNLFVDFLDLSIFNLALGSMPGDPNWNPDADFDGDDDVDADDLTILNAFFLGPPGP